MELPAHLAGTGGEELEFFAHWQDREVGSRRAWWAAAVSVASHLAVISMLVFTPIGRGSMRPMHQVLAQLREPIFLVAPPSELTQRAPNRGKIGKEFDLESLLPRPRVFIPPSPSPGAPPPGRPAPLPEPPKLDIAQAPLPGQAPGAAILPSPQIQPQEKPKLAMESPAATPGKGKLAPPASSVAEMTREMARGRGQGGYIVTDIPPNLGGIDTPLSNVPTPGAVGSSLELLSDPRGVDFKPYLIRALAAVKRNWMAVIPESARLGRRGRVVIQFVISKDGSVPKLVIASASGADALDRAAVAGISATNPFPPLPDDFRGNDIRLQFVFVYNMQP
jgi:TonB family protein